MELPLKEFKELKVPINREVVITRLGEIRKALSKLTLGRMVLCQRNLQRKDLENPQEWGLEVS